MCTRNFLPPCKFVQMKGTEMERREGKIDATFPSLDWLIDYLKLSAVWRARVINLRMNVIFASLSLFGVSCYLSWLFILSILLFVYLYAYLFIYLYLYLSIRLSIQICLTSWYEMLSVTLLVQFSLDEGSKTRLVSLDLSTTFDTITHNALLFKPKLLGIKGKLLMFFFLFRYILI